MTISSTTNRVTITGNGVTVDIPFPYAIFADTDLVVIETIIATGVQTTKTLTTHYSFSGTPDAAGHYPDGGTVTAVAAPLSTVTWTIYRDPPAIQGLDLVENDGAPAEAQEAQFDYLTMLIQRVKEQINRTLQQPEGDSVTIARLPAKVERASLFLAFDADGDPIAATGTTSVSTPVSAFAATLLDDANAAAAITTLGALAETDFNAKGELLVGTSNDQMSTLSPGSDGDMLIPQASLTKGIQWTTYHARSFAPNPFFQVDQLANSASSVADDVYGHDHWYALTQTAAILVSSQTLQENGQATNARLTQSQATAQRMGYACILEAAESQKLRGQFLQFIPRIRISNSQPVRMAVLEWTGTADAVTSDVVNSWTNATFTAGQFFNSTTLNVLGQRAITPSAATWTDGDSANPILVGSSCNNLILFIWTEGTAAQNVTLDIGKVRFTIGQASFPNIVLPTFEETLRYASRFFQKSFPYATAPVQNLGASSSCYIWPATKAGAATQISPFVYFPVRMRTIPAGTTYNPAAANAEARNFTDAADCTSTAIGAGTIFDNGFYLAPVGNAGAAVGETLGVHWSVDARL